MQGAYNGKFLRVDLTQDSHQVEEVPELAYRMYLDDSTLDTYWLARELKPGVDPLGPDNIQVISTCLTTGSPISGTNRFSVVAKSPLTGGYGEAKAGGW